LALALAAPFASLAATVTLTNGDAVGSSSFNTAGNWSNGQAPSSGNDYVVAVQYLRTPADGNSYAFAGNSLTLTNGGAMIYKGTAAANTYTITNFILNNGGLIRSGAGSGNTLVLAGTLTIVGTNANSEIRADQSPYTINSTLAGTGNLLFSTASPYYTTTLTGSNSYTGNITVTGLLTLWNGANLNFVIGGSGTNNSISGSGTATFNGTFDFNLSGASANLGDHWTIVNPAGLTVSYGNSFTVQGFTLQGGWDTGPGFWDLNTNGVYYEYCTTSGVLRVVSQPSTNGPGTWEMLMNGTEFSDTNTFAQFWSYNYEWGDTQNGSAVMSPTNISFAGNVMTIQSYPVSSADTSYNSGACWSSLWQLQVSSTFPCWQVSGTFQVNSATGCWPAMWLDGSTSWPPESDVMEYYSGVCHQNTYDGVWQVQTTNVSSPGSWHTYSATYTLTNSTWETIQYYIDGVLRSTQTAHSNFVGKSMWVIIDYQMNGSSGSTGPNYTTYLVCTNVTLSRQSMLTAAPAAPTNINVAAVNGSAAISWDGTANTTYYKVKRSLTSGGPYTNIASRLTSSPYIDTNLTNGTTYYYVVTARNAIGESLSSEVSATPQIPIDLNDPTTASSFQTGNDPSHGNDGDLTTRWTASGDTYSQWWQVDLGSTQAINKAIINWYNPSSRSYQYEIQTSDDGVNFNLVVNQTGRTAIGDSTDTFSATGRYVRVTVTGVNPSGGWAAFYECQLFGPPPAPPLPAAPSGLMATGGNAVVDLTWVQSTSPGITTNNVYRSTTGSGGPYSLLAGLPATTSYSDTAVVNGSNYFYAVTAVNTNGESAMSVPAGATPSAPPPPSAPSDLTATPGDTVVDLTWVQSTSPGITTNNVYRSTTGSGGPYGLLAGLPATTSYSDTAVVNGSNYFYTVTAVNTNGESAMSGPAGATPMSALQSWQSNYFGCTSCPQAQPYADPLGKGMNNTNQFLAGFNPTNPAAYLHIISVARANGTNVVVTYLGASGDTNYVPGIQSRTNVLDFTTGAASGGYSNGGWQDTGQTNVLGVGISAVGGEGTGLGTVTNMTDVGGATNSPSRYYRVRVLMP
jgi:fibronectin type 3 domain-containing protein